MGTYKIECNIGAACPICGADLEHSDDERDGRDVTETYQCDNCRIYISYHWTMPHPTRDELRARIERWRTQTGLAWLRARGQ